MASANLEDLNPAFRPLLNAYLASLDKAGIGYTVESGYRSPEKQAEIYARSHQGKDFPAAPPWLSFHNFGLAADVIPKNVADYARMHQLAAAAGLADARQENVFSYDQPHVEMPGQLADLVKQYHLANWRPADMPAPAQGALAFVGGGGSAGGGGASGEYKSDFVLPKDAPMGMRNNNPLNIKYAKDVTYPGLVGPSTNTDQGDPQNVFKTPEEGWAAGYSLLSKKYGAGMTTPAQIIAGEKGWTPGNMEAAKNVAKSMGIGVNDDIGFSNPTKAAKFMRALVTQEQGAAGGAYSDAMIANAIGGGGQPSGGSQTTAGGSAAPAATGAPAVAQDGSAGHLPGFTPNSQAEKMTQAGLKDLGLGGDEGGQTDKPMTDSPMLGPAPMAAGGPMMAGPGYQNVTGRIAGMNDLAQRGFLTQPSFAAFQYPGSLPPLTGQSPAAGPSPGGVLPSMASGTMGIPAGLPGTTLNSPSAAATAMLYGSLDPMDPYNRFGAGAAMQAANYGG